MGKNKFGYFVQKPQGLDQQFLNPASVHDKVIIVEGKKFYVVTDKVYSDTIKGLLASIPNNEALVLTDVSANEFHLFLSSTSPKYKITSENFAKLTLLSYKFSSSLLYAKSTHYLDNLKNLKDFNIHELLDLNVEICEPKLKDLIESELVNTFEAKKNWSLGLKNLQLAVKYNLDNVKSIVEMYFVTEFQEHPRDDKIRLLHMTNMHDCLENVKHKYDGLLLDEFKVCSKHNIPLLLDTAHKYGLKNLKSAIEKDLLKDFVNTKGKTQELYDKYLKYTQSYPLPELKEYLENFFIFMLKKEPINRIVQFLPTAKEFELQLVLDFIEMSLVEKFADQEDKTTLLISYLKGSVKYSFKLLKETIEYWLLGEFTATGNMRPLIWAFEYHLETYKAEVAEKYSSSFPEGQFYQQNREHIMKFPIEIQNFLLSAVMKNIKFSESN